MTRQKQKPPQTDPVPCAALAMAKLIGHYYETNETFDDAHTAAKDEPIARSRYERAGTAAFRICYVARNALALAPISSLDGAFAKMVAGIGLLEDADESLVDADKQSDLHLAYMLIEDGLAFFKREYGLTPESVGLGAFLNKSVLPMHLIATADKDDAE